MGYNSYKSHPLQARFADRPDRIFLHAEIDALRRALRYILPSVLEECTLLVTRRTKDGKLAMARPCAGCQRALATFGIREVRYTDEYGKVVKLW